MSPVTIYPHIDPVWPYLCTIAVFEALTVYLWQFRTIPGAKLLALCQAIKAFWLLSVVFYSISADIPTKLFWIRLSALTPVLLIYCWFKFILTLSEQKKTFPAVVRYGIPTIVVCLILIIFFDNQLGWHWKSISLDGQAFKAVFGPVSWATIGFSYFLGLLSIGLCIRWIFKVQGLRRQQAIALTLTPLFTLSGNILRRFPEFQAFAPQLIGLILGGLYTTWVFYRWQVYSILPLAHDAVSRSMIDGLLVVDEKGYIVEMNPTARTLFSSSGAVVGSRFQDLSATWPIMAHFHHTPDTPELEAIQPLPEGDRHFQITMTPLIATGDHLLGKVFMLKDITQQKQDQARLIAQQKALSTLAERDRLGRELHDTQGQFPGYVKTQAQAVRLLLNKGQAQDAAGLTEQLINAAEIAFLDEREAITCLKRSHLDWNFFQRLDEWLAQFRAMSGIAVQYRGPGQAPSPWLPPEAELHLLRVIQETLTNARKHAHANQITVELDCTPQEITITVADNGQGFDQALAQENGHFGLGIIRERVAEMGGQCTIQSSPADGTVLTVCVPPVPDSQTAGGMQP